jgi:acyl-CoA thioesterase
MLKDSHKEIARKVFETVPFINLIGMELIELKVGEATLQLKMREELRQPHGLLHGGATASLIDTATAFANVTVLKENEKAATVDLSIHYLRPVLEGTIICTAKVIKAGKRLSTISAEVVNEDGKLIATALSTYMKVG